MKNFIRTSIGIVLAGLLLTNKTNAQNYEVGLRTGLSGLDYAVDMPDFKYTENVWNNEVYIRKGYKRWAAEIGFQYFNDHQDNESPFINPNGVSVDSIERTRINHNYFLLSLSIQYNFYHSKNNKLMVYAGLTGTEWWDQITTKKEVYSEQTPPPGTTILYNTHNFYFGPNVLFSYRINERINVSGSVRTVFTLANTAWTDDKWDCMFGLGYRLGKK